MLSAYRIFCAQRLFLKEGGLRMLIKALEMCLAAASSDAKQLAQKGFSLISWCVPVFKSITLLSECKTRQTPGIVERLATVTMVHQSCVALFGCMEFLWFSTDAYVSGLLLWISRHVPEDMTAEENCLLLSLLLKFCKVFPLRFLFFGLGNITHGCLCIFYAYLIFVFWRSV